MTVSLSGSPSAKSGGGSAALATAAGEAIGHWRARTTLSTDYLARQLRHFAGGVRGAHPGDDAGKRMALSVANLNEADIPGLAVDHNRITPAQPAITITGNAARGEDYYVNISAPATAVTGKATTHSERLHSRASMIGT